MWDPVGAATCPFREPRGPEAGEAARLPVARLGWAPLWPSARPAHPSGPSGLTRLPVLVALLYLLSRQFSSQPLSLSLSSPALPPPIWKILPAPQVPLIMSLPFSGPFHVCSVFGDEVLTLKAGLKVRIRGSPPALRHVLWLPPPPRFLLLPPSPRVRVSLPVTQRLPLGAPGRGPGTEALPLLDAHRSARKQVAFLFPDWSSREPLCSAQCIVGLQEMSLPQDPRQGGPGPGLPGEGTLSREAQVDGVDAGTLPQLP